uniref:Retinoblastoma 1 n=1 Tax=Oryzias sinensis TaxID=183150 RepID=A0A8C7ZM19_9TELE
MPPKKRNSGAAQSKEPKPSSDKSFADKKGSPEFSLNKHTEKDVEFVTLCRSLHATDSVCERAWTLWKTVQDVMEDVDANQKRLWGSCLFVTATDMDAACFTLTEVLKAVNINVKQFVGLVRKLDVNLDTISTKVNSALMRVEKKYDVMLNVQENLCQWGLLTSLQMEDDLVISFQLLLCTLELFIKRSSPELLLPLYKSVVSKAQSPLTRTSRRNQSKAKSRVVESEVNVELLETLCKDNDCNAEEVKNVYQTSFSAFLDLMDLSRFPDFPLVTDVSEQYQEHYLKSGDIDGRLFFDGDETVLAPKVDISQVERTPKKTSLDDDGPLIPPQTPIRAAMNSIKMLRGDLPSSGDQPSSNLATYFKNCTVDPTQGIQKRLEMLGQVFSQKFGEAVGPHCIVYGRERFTLGVRLYYKVMEAMLESVKFFIVFKLLNDSTFHMSLLACALEVVMATYEESSFKNRGCSHGEGDQAVRDLCFPWILDVFDLSAFDFYKVIESFIKAEPTLSKDIIKHLETCENLIMEKIAWRTGSPLFELLKREHEAGATEQAEPPASFSLPLQHNHTAADLYLSPIRPGLRVLPPESPATPSSQASSQPTPQAAGQAPRQPKSNSLSLFYKKLYRLAYTRLKTLCSCLLSNHPDLEHVIWTLFQHTLQYEYDLMRDRHLDQLMMSAMYAICKVKSVDLRFKLIVSAYKNMPNTSQEENVVFFRPLSTASAVLSLQPPTLSPIPQIPCSPYKFPNSPLRVPGSNNVYISPLKNSRLSPGMMTPRSRMLVSIGESFGFANRFQKINQMVNSGDRAHKRTLDGGSALKPLKRLRFDVDGQDEADGSKSGGESALIQKLAEMSSTRSRMQEQKMKEDAESRKKST